MSIANIKVYTYEVARRIGDGKLGFVHFAVPRQAISAETHRVTAIVSSMILIVQRSGELNRVSRPTGER